MRLLLLILLSAVTIWAGYFSYQHIRYEFDTSAHAFSSPEEALDYEEYLSNFGKDSSGIILGFEKRDGFRKYEDFQVLDSVEAFLYRTEGIRQVTSLRTLKIPAQKGLSIQMTPIFPDWGEEGFEESIASFKSMPDIREKFLSKDETGVCMYCEYTEELETTSLYDDLKERFSEDFDAIHLLGGETKQSEGVEVLKQETFWLSFIAALIMISVLLLLIPDLRQLLTTFLITSINVSLCLCSMYLLDIPITVLTSAVPSIIAILSFTDQLHIYYHFKKLSIEGLEGKERHKKLFKTIGIPLILTSSANLMGFLIFFFNGGVRHINDLALTASIGIITSYLLSRFLLPFFLTAKKNSNIRMQKSYESFIERLILWIPRKRSWIISTGLGMTVLFALVLFNYSKIDSHYYRISNSDNDLQFETAAAFYDQSFQGIRDIEVVLKSEESLYTLETLLLIDEIEQYLLEEYGCKSVYSLNTIVKRFERFKKGGFASAYKLPNNLNPSRIEEMKQNKDDLGLKRIISEDERTTRIIGSINDIGTLEGNKRNQKLQAFIDQLEVKTELSIAGKSELYDRSIMRISKTILWCLFIGLLLIGIGIAILFRSIIIGIYVLWANLLPIGFAMTMMAFLEVDIHPSSLFMLTILLGVALDDSIYVIGNVYRKGPPKGFERSTVFRSMRTNSFPLLTTSIVIGFSFLALLFSSSSNTFAFGSIMSSSLLFAFLTDLIFLPSLLLTNAKSSDR